MFLDLLKSEALRFVSVRFSRNIAIFVLIVTVLFVSTFVLFSSTYFSLLNQRVNYSGILAAFSMFVLGWLPVVSVVYLAEDWRSSSALVSFAVVPNRVRLYLAKIVVIIAVTAALFALLIAASILVGLARRAEFGDFPRFAFFAFVIALRDVLFASALAVLFQSLFLPLVFWFLIPNVLSFIRRLAQSTAEDPEGNVALEIVRYFDFIPPDFFNSNPLIINHEITGLHFLVSVIAWIVVPLILGLWRLSRRDI